MILKMILLHTPILITLLAMSIAQGQSLDKDGFYENISSTTNLELIYTIKKQIV